MQVRFTAQPFEGGADLRDFLTAAAEDHEVSELTLVVAWAKRSGIARAQDSLRRIRKRGGRVRAIVGVSEGGATRQGLELLMSEADDVWVFHDAGRTFHPKVYLARGLDSSELLVGSHNLTAGGYAWNYEAGLWCTLPHEEEAARGVLSEVSDYIDRLISDRDVCIALTEHGLETILRDPRVRIADEDRRYSAPNIPDSGPLPEDADSFESGGDGAELVFGKSVLRKRALPRIRSSTPWKRPPPAPAPVSGCVPGALPGSSAVRRWFKEMDHTAAQQRRGEGSNVTGNLRLSREDFSIDWTTYFIDVFFGDMDWRPSATKPQTLETWVPVYVQVDGDYLGLLNIRLSHNPGRVSNQGNVPTVLHWGDLGPRMRANNYIGKYVTLERRQDDSVTLIVASQPTGEFRF